MEENSEKLLAAHSWTRSCLRILLGSSSPSNGDFEWFFSLPPLVYEVEYGEEKAKDHEDYDDKSEDFVPRLVFIEYYKEEKAKDEHDDDNNDEDSDGFHGYDGYDEDNDDEGNSSDVSYNEDEEDDDLDRRIEEFIAKNYKKWSEELPNDKLLCIEAA
ncbi:hypothetical protein F0562_019122 [Nyssa sinensis]|uniref:Uncharacterized protein n=1 Tax=Nyssa sinensis TaxID=561372 RepID=A0A5J4ZAY7_9ASTE|nr:hypothetical protein F0562_019122 [Nyssa sinensis]